MSHQKPCNVLKIMQLKHDLPKLTTCYKCSRLLNLHDVLHFEIVMYQLICTSVTCALSPSVNEHIEGSIDFSFKNQFLQFVWIFNNKIHSKINIFHTLALKIMKQTLLNTIHQGFSNNTKNTSKFQCSFSFHFI
jgi:hypothetical protein